MEKTPKGMRLHIAILGAVNAGKSSFLNYMCGQQKAITSEIEGTTTDAVEKSQELLPIGPITWIDTAGFGDKTELSAEREAATKKVLERADVAVLVSLGEKTKTVDENIMELAEAENLPVIKVFNKKDLYAYERDALQANTQDPEDRDNFMAKFKAELIKICPEEFINPPTLFGDLVPDNGTVILLVPIDKEAPKGRLILPQAQTIRDGLDNNQIMMVMQESRYKEFLSSSGIVPDLVICDSQIVDFMVKNTPNSIKCTTFSILFGRLRGDLNKFCEGAAYISKLKESDKVLIAESCTHHAQDDDIAHVKIPRWLRQKIGENLQIDYASGCDFPENLSEYSLVIQCGGCVINRREVLSRINKCEQAGVPITNYGICISELKGVLERVIEPFSEIKTNYIKIKA